MAGLFLCPLCHRTFNGVEKLSKAHILAKGLGGQDVTLTCKQCNDFAGDHIEPHEIARARDLRTTRGQGNGGLSVSLRASDVDGIPVRVAATMRFGQGPNANSTTFEVAPKACHPDHLRKLEKKLRSGDTGWEFTVEGRLRSGGSCGPLAYLHAAFLLAFHENGYGWALDDCTQPIREQLLNPSQDIIPVHIFRLRERPSDPNCLSIRLVYAPQVAMGFLVCFPRLQHLEHEIAVWLPFYGQPYASSSQLADMKTYAQPLPQHHKRLSNPASIYYAQELAELLADLAQ